MMKFGQYATRIYATLSHPGGRRALGLAAAVLMLPAFAQAATYYLSPTGSDANPGTYTQPFRTVAKGVQAAKPGDTLILKDGTYPDEGGNTGWLVWISKAGTASSWITMKAEHKWGAILDCQKQCSGYLYFDSGAAYWRIEDLVVQNTLANAIHMNSTPAAHDLIFKGNLIRNVGGYYTSSQIGICGVYAGPGQYNLVFDGNVFHDIGRTGPADMMAHDHGLYLHSSNTTIINNLFYSLAAGWGVQTASGFSGVIENNTFAFPMSTQVGQLMLWDTNGDVMIRNNIFYEPASTAITTYAFSPKSCTIDHNIIFGPSTVISGSGCSVSSNYFIDPKLSNAASYDFSLTAGSPAIDKGVTLSGVTSDFDGTPRPQGAAYDIGAYEYISGSTSAAPPAPPVISNVTASSVSTNSATITWTTDMPADSQVDYGTSTGYGSSTPLDSTLVLQHSVAMSNLTPGTTYHYRAGSRDSDGQLTLSGDYTFTTAQLPPPPPAFAFSLAASPASVSLAAGQSASARVTATLTSGSAQPVSFNVAGLPAGVTAAFSPASCLATCTTTLTFSAQSSAPAATANLAISAAGGGAAASTSISLTVAAAASTPTATPDSSAAAQWLMDEGAGAIVHDSSGHGNTGAVAGSPVWATGTFGTALALTGSNYVSVPESASLEFSTQFTVSFWINATNVPYVDERIISKNYDWDVKLNGSRNNLQLSAGGAYAMMNYSLPMGTWQHVVFTFSYGTVKGYVNGIQQTFAYNTFGWNKRYLPSYRYGLYIGTDPSRTMSAKGLIDDVRLYNRALSPAEVMSLYSQTKH